MALLQAHPPQTPPHPIGASAASSALGDLRLPPSLYRFFPFHPKFPSLLLSRLAAAAATGQGSCRQGIKGGGSVSSCFLLLLFFDRSRSIGPMDGEVLDSIIGRLLEVRTARPGTLVRLTEAEIHQLCVASREIFLAQPNLLELEAPIKICGQLLSLCFPCFNMICSWICIITQPSFCFCGFNLSASCSFRKVLFFFSLSTEVRRLV